MLYFMGERTALRNLTDSDLAFLCELRSDESCARYQRWEDNSAPHIQKMINEHRADALLSQKEIQRFIICTTSGTPIGTLVLFVTPSDGCISVGITIATPYQRQGYARDLLLALISRIGKTHPSLDIVALIHPENTPSVRLFESLGFVFDLYAESIHSLVYILPHADQHA